MAYLRNCKFMENKLKWVKLEGYDFFEFYEKYLYELIDILEDFIKS